MARTTKILAIGAALAAGCLTLVTLGGALPAASVAGNRTDTGNGETLILVIADQVADRGAASQALDGINARFGHLQGLYDAASDDFEVTGFFVQSTADLVRATCDRPGGSVRTTVRSVSVVLECPAGSRTVHAFVPAGLVRVPRSGYTGSAFPSPCGSIGQPPCQEQLYRRILGEHGRFAPGAGLVLTAFRTKKGAEEFVDLARALDVTGLVVVEAKKLGGGYVGLGQEAASDGSGPLTRR